MTCPQALWYTTLRSCYRRNKRAFGRNEDHHAIRLKILPEKDVHMSQSHPSRFWLLLVAGTIDIRTQKRFWPKWTRQAYSPSKVPTRVRPTIWALDQHPRPYSSAYDWVVFFVFFHKSTPSLQKKAIEVALRAVDECPPYTKVHQVWVIQNPTLKGGLHTLTSHTH